MIFFWKWVRIPKIAVFGNWVRLTGQAQACFHPAMRQDIFAGAY